MPKRYVIVGITAVAALWLYIDRICFSTLADPIKTDLLLPQAPDPSELEDVTPANLEAAIRKKRDQDPSLGDDVPFTPEEMDSLKRMQWADKRMEYVLSAFFLTYALLQIPMGALADRFGARLVLGLSIAAWSLVTAATGFAQTFFVLVGIRLMLGASEAAAYPAAAGLIKNWARPQERGRFSSVVALGGRIGGASAGWLTAMLATALVGIGLASWMGNPSGVNWRGVFVVYGLCGLAVALLFWLVVRDRPPAQPAPPPAPEGSEPDGAADWLALPPQAAPPAPSRTFLQRLGLLVRSRNMWLYSTMQFGVNIGWVFLITLLPTYLNRQFNMPLEERGRMQSIVLIIGLCGMFLGGIFTDGLRAWLGPRLGRSVPLGVALGGCALAFFLIPALASVWAVVVALGVMAFLVDMHNPTVWSFAQDVGGKNVGAALGFGNMFGNFGAVVSSILIGGIAREAGWNAAFIVCGIGFAIAATCGLLLDATKPIEEESHD